MITTSSQSRSTRSSWWLEKSTGTPAAARRRSRAAMTSTATGSRPLNGSSRISSSGSCTSAAATWARCWLPSDSFSSGSPARGPEAELVEQLAGPPLGRTRGVAVQPREEDELVEHRHLRVEAALLGHVAEAAALGRPHRRALPEHLARVGREDAHDDPHRGGLAGAVGADEAGEDAGPDGEPDVVEREHRAEPAGQGAQFEHVPTLDPSAGRGRQPGVGAPVPRREDAQVPRGRRRAAPGRPRRRRRPPARGRAGRA